MLTEDLINDDDSKEVSPKKEDTKDDKEEIKQEDNK